MPGKIKVKILAGRNLPVMDRSGDTTDAYVEIKFGNTTYKTDVCRKSLNPQWNSEWYRFEVDDAELQDEPLQIRLMDHDTYSANDAIGKVYLNLNPLLLPGVPPPVKNIWTLEATMNSTTNSQGGCVMTGWMPVYDTMHGIRGEVNVIVKVELFLDFNKFRQSSCGVQFFYSPNIPFGYFAQAIHGFVEELVVCDDPEYKWIDKIRTPRASNEARQILFFKLSGELQRKIGLKALDLGGNAVVGYLQTFDLEGECGIIARGIGTAVTLVKLHDLSLVIPEMLPTEDLTLLGVKYRQSDCSESDESVPILSLSQRHSPVPSAFNSQSTRINNTVPISGANNQKTSIMAMKVIDHKSTANPLRRNLSTKSASGSGLSLKKGLGSSLSLTDELSDENPLKVMLALEDMRGEPSGNRFSQGLRNLRYLPQSLLSKRSDSKVSDCFDEESDLESAYSSSWSVPESSRPAAINLHHSLKRKKLTRKKNNTDGIAAQLIRSVHSGLPLDSVREDRETPTPSPVNFLDDSPTTSDSKKREGESSEEVTPDSDTQQEESKPQVLHVTYSKLRSHMEDNPIPMISSSETDTSSSEDDPSESSTNYNILDDSFQEPVSFDSGNKSPSPKITLSPSASVQNYIKPDENLLFISDESKSEEIALLDNLESKTENMSLLEDLEPKKEEMFLLESKESIDVEPIQVTSNVEFAFPVDKAIVVLPKIADSEPKKIDNLIDISDDTFKRNDQENKTLWGPEAILQEPLIPTTAKLPSEKPENDKKHRLHRQLSYQSDDLEYSPSSDDEYYAKEKVIRYPHLQKKQKDKKLENTFTNQKSSKRVERTETVIYKGPTAEAEPTTSAKPHNMPVTAAPQHDMLHLMVPIKSEEVNVRSPYPEEELQAAKDFTSEELIADMIRKNRQSSMLELIRIIDTKMLIRPSHHERKDSSKKKRHDRISKNQTPSPVAHRSRLHRRKSRSKSPDFTKMHGLIRNHFASNKPQSSKGTNRAHDSVNILTKTQSNTPDSYKKDSASLTDQKSNNLEMHALTISEGTPSLMHKTSAVSRPDQIPKSSKTSDNANTTDNLCVPHSLSVHRQQDDASLSPTCPTTALVTSTSVKASQSPVMKSSSLHRRSSDSDLSITPKGNSLTGSERSVGGYSKPTATVMRTTNRDALEMLEYPFLTMQLYPPGFIRHLGGLVSARSVKLIERINNLEEPEGRDSWWKEIRMEIRSHARALACNVVIGYKEETSLCDDVCVLSASGTAAVISFHNPMPDADGGSKMPNQMATSIESDRDKQTKGKSDKSDSDSAIPSQTGKVKRISESNDHEVPYGSQLSACALCHLPYREKSVPFRMNVSKCAVCRKAKVPEVMFTTIELPENIPLTGNGCFIQATVCKSKKDLKGELNAKEISDCLPFLEYEVHSLLLNKLRVRGMNGIFGLRIQVTVGEKLVVGMAVGTAVFLTALPPPTLPQIGSNNSWHNEEQLAEIRKTLTETLRKNREYYHLKTVPDVDSVKSNASDTEDSDDELLPDMNIGVGSKDACVLEIDDLEDMDRISLLIDDRPPDDFHVVNTQSIPGLEDLEIVRNLQMFTQVSRSKIPVTQTSLTPSKHFTRLLQTVFFKLRRMVPCALCDMQFRVALPEQDEIQLCVVGMALGLGEPTKSFAKFRRKTVSHCIGREQVKKSDDTDMIFRLDEDQTENQVGDSIHSSTTLLTTNLSAQKPRSRSPLRLRSNTTIRRHRHVPLKERYGVDITPLSYLPGGRIERYLGNLNFFFIRESNSIRENGGLSGFTHSFVTEVLAIVRAHVTALGGNAMVAYFMTHCVLLHSPHKNQGQCLINVGGDVVCVSYFAEDKQGAGNTNC